MLCLRGSAVRLIHGSVFSENERSFTHTAAQRSVKMNLANFSFLHWPRRAFACSQGRIWAVAAITGDLGRLDKMQSLVALSREIGAGAASRLGVAFDL
jgi:hypothetical protein